MPLALIVIGGIILLVAVRNTHADLGKLLVEDFTGSEGAVGFFVWLGALAFVGALGWVPALKTPSRILLAIIILGIIGSNTGVFQRITEAIANPPTQTAAKPDPTQKIPDAFPVAVGGGGSGGSSTASTALSAVKSVIPFFG